MKITALQVENFKAAKRVSLEDLGSMVVIAGPNGCGKSCLFDAVRFLKSSYGGYQPNEWQQWFNEFQINIRNRPADVQKLFHDNARPIKIRADFLFAESELDHLRENAKVLSGQLASHATFPDDRDHPGLAALSRLADPEVSAEAERLQRQLEEELQNPLVTGEVVIHPDLNFVIEPSAILEAIFSRYAPENIGIIDYHGPNRDYARENLGGINLSIDATEGRLKQHALYNYGQKYKNIKTEMAAQLVRDSLSAMAEGGATLEGPTSLVETLQELFATFFPDKRFVGPKPTSDGRILFPVELPDGNIHDIDELSSGEKEVLYGYLRIHNTAPKGSVLLLDEPELHLNPRLIRGLPTFYKKHLGESLDNQLWLITHSDAILREALGELAISVYHMQLPHLLTAEENQVEGIANLGEADRAIIDLVGDLATYRPGLKTVIFEGGGDSDFDVKMVEALFPTMTEKLNPVSAGNRSRVRELHEVLSRAAEAGNLPSKFYSVVDRDHIGDESVDGRTVYEWNVYHIENYLLHAGFIEVALRELSAGGHPLNSADSVETALRDAARQTLNELVVFELRQLLNSTLVRQFSFGASPNSANPAGDLFQSAKSSAARISDALEDTVSEEALIRKEASIRARLEGALEDGTWKSTFRGRDVLKRFVGAHGEGTKYEAFRNLILFRMRDAGYRPEGMEQVIQSILGD